MRYCASDPLTDRQPTLLDLHAASLELVSSTHDATRGGISLGEIGPVAGVKPNRWAIGLRDPSDSGSVVMHTNTIDAGLGDAIEKRRIRTESQRRRRPVTIQQPSPGIMDRVVDGPGISRSRLGDVLTGGPTLLVFLRHFG